MYSKKYFNSEIIKNKAFWIKDFVNTNISVKEVKSIHYSCKFM